MPGLSRKPAVCFTPADAGTPEALWDAFLRKQPAWSPDTTDIVVVAPHPDDEVLGAGGLIRACAANGQRVTVVSVTDGEAADPSRSNLGLVRRAELHNALRALSPVHVPVERLGLPDGAVRHSANRLRAMLDDLLSPTVTLIAPYEHDGHPDHDCVGSICVNLAAVYRLPIARYPVWAWHHSQPDGMSHLPWRTMALSAEVSRAKVRAIGCFSSQLEPPTGEPILPPHVVSHFDRAYEAFLV